MIVAGILLYFFMRMTAACCAVVIPEGLQSATYLKHTWLVLLCGFVLTVIYLPLSTMAVHVLVWSDDLWVIPNPYTNATTLPPEVAPLGPSEEYREPLDFCYTTTMLRNEINYAPVVVIIAIICFLAVSSHCLLGDCADSPIVDDLVSHTSAPDNPSCHTEGGSLYRAWRTSQSQRHGPRIPAIAWSR